MPFGYELKDITLTAESGDPSCAVEFTQHIYKTNNLFAGKGSTLPTDWDNALAKVSDLRSGIVIKLTQTV